LWGFDVELTTSNYGLITTPKKEYEISTGQRLCPEEEMKDKKGRRVRVIKPIEELKLVKVCQKAGLTDDEILAVVRPLLKNAQTKCSVLTRARRCFILDRCFRCTTRSSVGFQ
jgi:hypothetical protein